jgi:hypothetical protein
MRALLCAGFMGRTTEIKGLIKHNVVPEALIISIFN